MFAWALAAGGLDRDGAARAMGVSGALVSFKCNPARPEPVTLGDVVDLIDGAPDAGEAMVRALQARLDARRGQRPPSLTMLPRLCLFIGSLVGELCAEVSTSVAEPNEETRAKVRKVCAHMHAQLARLEACVGTGTERRAAA